MKRFLTTSALILLVILAAILPGWSPPLGAQTTTWTGTTGQNLAYGLTTDGTYNYIGGSEYHGGPAWIAKVSIATNQTVLVWNGAAGQGNLIGLIYLNNAVYGCFQSVGIYPSHVIKVATATMTTVWVWDDPDEVAGTLLNANTAGIATDDEFIYFGREQGVSKIWKLTQGKVEAGLWTAPSGAGARVFSLAIHKATRMLYAASDSRDWRFGKGLAYKINTDTMATVLPYQPLDDDGYAQGIAVDETGAYVYVASRQINLEGSAPIRISRISTSTMTKVSQWDAPAGQFGSGTGMIFAKGYILVPTYFTSSSEQLVMLDPVAMKPAWSWSAPAGQTGMYGVLPLANDLYISFFNYNNPPAMMVTIPFPLIRTYSIHELWTPYQFSTVGNIQVVSVTKTANPAGYQIIYIQGD